MNISEKIRNTIAAYVAADETWEEIDTINKWYDISDSIYQCLNKSMGCDFIISMLEDISIRLKAIASKKKYLIVDYYFDVKKNDHVHYSQCIETDKIEIFCVIVDGKLTVRVLYDNFVYDINQKEEFNGGLVYQYVPALITNNPKEKYKKRNNYWDYQEYEEEEEW